MQQAALLRAEQAMDQVCFFEKIFIFGHGQVEVQAQPGFQGQLVCSKFKLKFFAGIQLFGLKTTSHGKPGPDQKSKIKSTTMSVHHVKGQPAALTYVREKEGYYFLQ